MTRVLFHVEGQTEESFVRELLRPHLAAMGIAASARLIGNARRRDRRGGIRGWPETLRDITNHLRQDQNCVATLMVDYYGLPAAGEKEWPGRAMASQRPFHQKASTVQDALSDAIGSAMGYNFNGDRFIPFVVMHEFEGLLFSDCENFVKGIGRPNLSGIFQDIRDQFGSPEEINDSVETAPSKRILKLVPNYQKPLQGTLAASEIGLDAIRAQCPNFAHWMGQLEALGS